MIDEASDRHDDDIECGEGFHSTATRMSFMQMPPNEITARQQSAWRGVIPSLHSLIRNLDAEPTPEFDSRLFDLEAGARIYGLHKNPVDLLVTFAQFVEAGFYPPPDILIAIAEFFDEWRASQAHESLDKIMGLASEGKGKPALPKSVIQRKRDLEIMLRMNILLALGATIDSAAEMVAGRFDANPKWNNSGWNVQGNGEPVPAVKTIQNIYAETDEARRQFVIRLCKHHFNVGFLNISRELTDFPPPLEAAPTFMPKERTAAIKEYPTPRPLEISI